MANALIAWAVPLAMVVVSYFLIANIVRRSVRLYGLWSRSPSGVEWRVALQNSEGVSIEGRTRLRCRLVGGGYDRVDKPKVFAGPGCVLVRRLPALDPGFNVDFADLGPYETRVVTFATSGSIDGVDCEVIEVGDDGEEVVGRLSRFSGVVMRLRVAGQNPMLLGTDVIPGRRFVALSAVLAVGVYFVPATLAYFGQMPSAIKYVQGFEWPDLAAVVLLVGTSVLGYSLVRRDAPLIAQGYREPSVVRTVGWDTESSELG